MFTVSFVYVPGAYYRHREPEEHLDFIAAVHGGDKVGSSRPARTLGRGGYEIEYRFTSKEDRAAGFAEMMGWCRQEDVPVPTASLQKPPPLSGAEEYFDERMKDPEYAAAYEKAKRNL